jgi:hypothetical protein
MFWTKIHPAQVGELLAGCCEDGDEPCCSLKCVIFWRSTLLRVIRCHNKKTRNVELFKLQEAIFLISTTLSCWETLVEMA